MIKNTEAGAFSSLWPQGICRTCCLGWISDRVVTGNFARVGTECRARSWFCGGRGCRWAWRNRGAGAIKRGKACRDLSFRRGARWPWARPGARAKLAERPLGGARGCGAQAPAQDGVLDFRGGQRHLLQDISKLEPLDYLALESNACGLLKGRKYFLNQISDGCARKEDG